MNLSLRSLRLAPLSLVAALALGASGCVVDAGIDGGPGVVVTNDVTQEPIDTDAQMATTPGDGAALYVETKADGHWAIYTSCDTNTTGQDCNFDVLITPVDSLASLDNVTGTDLTDADSLTVENGGTVHLVTSTTGGLDGVEFDTDPGGIVEIDVLLDGNVASSYVTWVSGGVVQQGVDTNPVDFAPEAP